jgi:hypothetical protein
MKTIIELHELAKTNPESVTTIKKLIKNGAITTFDQALLKHMASRPKQFKRFSRESRNTYMIKGR